MFSKYSSDMDLQWKIFNASRNICETSEDTFLHVLHKKHQIPQKKIFQFKTLNILSKIYTCIYIEHDY